MARKKTTPEPIKFSFGFKLKKRASHKRIEMVNDDTRKAFYTLELLEDNSNLLAIYKVTSTFGKLGTTGRTTVIAKGSKEECTKALNKRYQEKLKKGYKLEF